MSFILLSGFQLGASTRMNLRNSVNRKKHVVQEDGSHLIC